MNLFDIPKLTLRQRTAEYANGKARIVQILEAAYDIMLAEGFEAITMREIARRCEIRVGAVNYYYKSRTDLMQDLFEACLNPYFELYDNLVEDERYSVEERLERLIRAVLKDIQTEQTTKIFPELWSIANRDPWVSDLVDRIYVRQRCSYERLIGQLNPGLGDVERKALTLWVSASIEGQTMFVGFQRPQADLLPAIETLAVHSIITLVKSITNEEIRRSLPSPTKEEETETPEKAAKARPGAKRSAIGKAST